jgi:hypothetical protein
MVFCRLTNGPIPGLDCTRSLTTNIAFLVTMDSIRAHEVGHALPAEGRSSELARPPFPPSLVTSDTSTETVLKPVKLLEGIGKGSREISSGLTVQSVCLD